MTAAEHAAGFAHALLGGRPALDGSYVTLWTLPDKRTRWYPANDAGAVASAVTALAGARGNEAVYIGIGLTDRTGKPDQRPKAYPETLDDIPVTGLLGVAADIDIAGPAHADSKKLYPQTVHEARRVLAAMALPPTIEVHSGHGLQPWWLFTEPMIFGQVDLDDDGRPVVDPGRAERDRKDAIDLMWSWVTTMRVHARALGGWDIDPTGDLARLLRAPGSTNRKILDAHRPVCLEVNRAGTTYNPDDLLPYLADPATLQTYRLAGKPEIGGALEGVDVHAVWARVHSSTYARHQFLPGWLAQLLDLDAELGGRLGATFRGQRPDLGGDENVIDASLARQLADIDATAEQICEALMCRRLRSGKKVDKIDPSKRVDYLARTVGRFVGTSRARSEQVRQREASARDAVDRAVEVAAGLVHGVESGRNGSTPDDPPPPADEAPSPADDVRPATPPAPSWNWLDEDTAGRPAASVSEDERAALVRITGMLALPEGYTIARAEYRRGSRRDEIRLWVHRGLDTDAPPGRSDWAPDSLSATRWHPKSGWEQPGAVTNHLLHDCHLVCGVPAKGWRKSGLPLLYAMLREVLIGTPRASVRAAIRDLLLSHPPIPSFGEARDNGHCWLLSNKPGVTPVVGVPVPTLRRHLMHMGEAGPIEAAELITLAAAMGCEVRPGVCLQEHFRTIRDARTWLIVAPSILTAGDWAAVRQAIADHAERAGTNVRPIRRDVG